jgi:hypothetical protein
MESTKVVSLRMDRLKYEDILIFCNKRGIPFSQWLEGRLAIADNSDFAINNVRKRLRDVIDIYDTLPEAAKRRLKNLLRDLGEI